MINNIRETGCPRIDILDDVMLKTEQRLTKLSCFIVTAPLAGTAKIITGIFQTIIALLVTVVLLPTNFKLVKERWITHIQNGLGNILRGLLETVPFIGLGMWVNERRRESPVSNAAFERLEYQGMFSKIQYPSIQLRKWKVIYHPQLSGSIKDSENSTRFLENKVKEKLSDQKSLLTLKERNNIINHVYFNHLDDDGEFVEFER